MRGATITDATMETNVDRTTFYLWLKSNANFVAELNRAKQHQAEAWREQLRGLSDSAVATLREMVTGKDVPAGVRLKAALSVLQSVGMLEPEPIVSTSLSEIEMRQALDNL